MKRAFARLLVVGVAALPLPACQGWNPWGASPGETTFKMDPSTGAMDLRTNGVERKRAIGSVKMPNGTEIKFRIEDSNASQASENAVNNATQQQLAWIAMMSATSPALAKALIPLAAAAAGIPIPPVVP